MNEPKHLDSLFKEKLLRILDYQRLYAWGREQLDSFWEDLVNLPDGRKNYTKTKPVRFDEFGDCIKWFKLKRRKENDQAWKVPVDEVLKYDGDGKLESCNLDIKNPTSAEALEHLPPEQLADDILAKELRVIEIMKEIKLELAKAGA